MSPLEQLQSDVLGKLLSEPLLALLNIKSLRKMRIQSELDLNLIYASPRTALGKIGCGVIVGMPSLSVEHPNTPGPLLSVTLPVRVYEEPLSNLSAAIGTLITAETASVLIAQVLHLIGIQGLCSLYCGRDTMRDIDSPPGTLGYEVAVRAELAEGTIPRVTLPAISESNLTVTLTPSEDDVVIYYTTDGSFPGPSNTDGNCKMYAQPFAVAGGTTLRWAGYVNPAISTYWTASDIGQAILSRGTLATEDLSKLTIPAGGGIAIE